MKTAIYFVMFLLLLCVMFLLIIRQNMKIQSMYGMNNRIVKGVGRTVNHSLSIGLPHDSQKDHIRSSDISIDKLQTTTNAVSDNNINQRITVGEYIHNPIAVDKDIQLPVTEDRDNRLQMIVVEDTHTNILENKDIPVLTQMKGDEATHHETTRRPIERPNIYDYVTSKPHIKLWSTPRVTDAFQVLCDDYEILPTQIINGLWQSSNSELDKDGNSLNKDYRGFRAYFDDRNPEYTIIRVIGSPNWDLTVTYNTGLYCTLWYPSGTKYTTVVPQKDIVMRTGLKLLNKQKSYQINIKVPFRTIGNEKPTHVSISFSPCILSMKLPVQYPSGRDARPTAVCVPVIYDRIRSKEALAIIEWVELYKHFGVDQFFFYSVNTFFEPPVAKVFDYYSKLGIINVTRIPPVTTEFSNVAGFTLSKSVSKNSFDDCLLRNIYEYKYLLTVDLDDVMVPKQHPTFEALVDSINQKYSSYRTSFSGYHVKNINFFLDYGPTLNNTDPLITSRYFENSGAGTIRHRTKIKPIINAQKCLVLWNHACLKGITRGDRPIGVDLEKAQNYHFRRSCSASFMGTFNETKVDMGRVSPCDENLRNGVEDNFILKFRPHLLSKVVEIAKLLNLDLNDHY